MSAADVLADTRCQQRVGRGRCRADGIACTIVDYSGPEPVEYEERYCAAHAAQQGYCRGCGLFCAGIETFDFGRHPGYCDNCQDEIEHDMRDEEDTDWDEADLLDEPLRGLLA